jgi:hypothetical protein
VAARRPPILPVSIPVITCICCARYQFCGGCSLVCSRRRRRWSWIVDLEASLYVACTPPQQCGGRGKRLLDIMMHVSGVELEASAGLILKDAKRRHASTIRPCTC